MSGLSDRNHQNQKGKKERKMAKLTFRGGVHPYDGKDLSKDKPMKTIVPKGEMVYPLSQHIGAPAVPIVKKGIKCLWDKK